MSTVKTMASDVTTALLLCLASILLQSSTTQGEGLPSASTIRDNSLFLSHYTNHNNSIGSWELFPNISFSCQCNITSWTFIATELPHVNSGESILFQIWTPNTLMTYSLSSSIQIERSKTQILSSVNSMDMSLVKVSLESPIQVREGDILGIFQPSSGKSELILQFQEGLAPGHYLRPSNTPYEEFVTTGVITNYDHPLIAVEHDCAEMCTSGFMNSESVERFFDSNPNSCPVNHRGFYRFLPALNFTCNTHLTRIRLAAMMVFGTSSPLLDIWRGSSPRGFSRLYSIEIANATATNDPGVYEYIPYEPLPISTSDTIALCEPVDSGLRLYSEKDAGMYPFSVYINDVKMGEVNSELAPLGDDDLPLLTIETADDGCTAGFMSHNDLVRKSLSLALTTQYNTQCVVPDMRLPWSGNLTKLIFSGQFLETTGSNTRTFYPEIQIWRMREDSNGDTYDKIESVGYSTVPEFSGDVNVYQYTFEIPLPVQEGDVLGYYQPPSSDSLMGVVSIEDRGPQNYCLFNYNPDTITLSRSIVGTSTRTPLINFEYALQGRYPGNDGTENDTNNDDVEDSSNIALIVGGAVGALLVVALVVGFVFLIVVLWMRGRERGKGKEGGGEFTDIRNPTYEDGEQPTYANPSEFRPPLSPLCHYYSPPGSPYEQPTVSSPASRAATMNHNYQTLELHQRGRVALAGSAASGGNSPLDAVRVDLAVMTSDSSGTALRDRGMHEEVIYHEPSEVWTSSMWGVYVPTEEQRASINRTKSNPMQVADCSHSDHINEYDNLESNRGDHMSGSGPVFFKEETRYWRPASNARSLYRQLSSKKYRELPRQQISVSQHLGSGQFGMVAQGVWSSLQNSVDVAVKTLKPGSSELDKIKFLQEAAINGQFRHPNIVKLLGVVTIGQPVMIVLELLSNGDLSNYLIGQRPNGAACSSDLSPRLLQFCRDIASGMEYLASKAFVHRDLAARNILVSKNFICKISDFGMSRDLEQETYYVSKGGKIPIKWTAPEAIHYKKYSTASDVWSYGCLMYEIWSLGHKPFSQFTNSQTISLLESAFCLPPPPGTPREIYSIMVLCWNPDKSRRPTFTELCSQLALPPSRLLHWSSEDAGPAHRAQASVLGAPLRTGHTLHLLLQNSYNTH